MVDSIKLWLLRNLRKEQGQDLAEYGMLIGLIALAVVGAVIVLGGNLNTVFTSIGLQIGPWVP
ncbi:MAG TPA: Flp family type IVb pilin [Anaerolineales bacterium]|nr:Flp family type IVb pilin [Anaerolineales bacterium]